MILIDSDVDLLYLSCICLDYFYIVFLINCSNDILTFIIFVVYYIILINCLILFVLLSFLSFLSALKQYV